MGLFSKLTEKKECGICGKELGLLGKSKVEDGYICKDCERKLSPFFTGRRHTTLEDIQGQLDCREENRKLVASFRPERQIGDTWRLLLDDTDGWLVVTRNDDWREENPDVIFYRSVEGADVRVDEERHELTYEDADGNTQRYNPPRYEEEYDFYLTIRLRGIPYLERIEVKLNTWEVKRRFSPEYDRYERMAAEMRDALRNLNAGGREAAGTPQAAYGQPQAQAAPQAQPPRFCPNCGAPATGGNFCESCGSRLA